MRWTVVGLVLQHLADNRGLARAVGASDVDDELHDRRVLARLKTQAAFIRSRVLGDSGTPRLVADIFARASSVACLPVNVAEIRARFSTDLFLPVQYTTHPSRSAKRCFSESFVPRLISPILLRISGV